MQELPNLLLQGHRRSRLERFFKAEENIFCSKRTWLLLAL
jgi:hypothetical protein